MAQNETSWLHNTFRIGCRQRFTPGDKGKSGSRVGLVARSPLSFWGVRKASQQGHILQSSPIVGLVVTTIPAI